MTHKFLDYAIVTESHEGDNNNNDKFMHACIIVIFLLIKLLYSLIHLLNHLLQFIQFYSVFMNFINFIAILSLTVCCTQNHLFI